MQGEYGMRWIHAFQYGFDGGATQYKAMPSAKHAFDYDLENCQSQSLRGASHNASQSHNASHNASRSLTSRSGPLTMHAELLRPTGGGLNRASFNAIVSDRDQVEYYFPAWRAAVEGGRVGSVMCSYNAVNGVSGCPIYNHYHCLVGFAADRQLHLC